MYVVVNSLVEQEVVNFIIVHETIVLKNDRNIIFIISKRNL